ncbi:hypothetical protein KHA80_17020 [Anaerobacillus sp. HL2]|nr:hypothetical protein KHA80_17020 [Anaerobacillus sp. HL2]
MKEPSIFIFCYCYFLLLVRTSKPTSEEVLSFLLYFLLNDTEIMKNVKDGFDPDKINEDGRALFYSISIEHFEIASLLIKLAIAHYQYKKTKNNELLIETVFLDFYKC